MTKESKELKLKAATSTSSTKSHRFQDETWEKRFNQLKLVQNRLLQERAHGNAYSGVKESIASKNPIDRDVGVKSPHSPRSIEQSTIKVVSQIVQNAQIKLPYLKDLSQSSMIRFYSDFQDYSRNCPKSFQRKPQFMVPDKFYSVIVSKSKLSREEIYELAEDDFFRIVFNLHEVSCLSELIDRLTSKICLFRTKFHNPRRTMDFLSS